MQQGSRFHVLCPGLYIFQSERIMLRISALGLYMYHLKEHALFLRKHLLSVSDEVLDNTRYKCLSFSISQNCVLHGFSGYFDTVLYKSIVLSIVPETHSRGMFSWFPIFFPFCVCTLLLYVIVKPH
jgi:hypothetical protein